MNILQQANRNVSLTLELIRRGGGSEVGSIIRSRVWGSQFALGMARDLSVPFPAPEPLIPISLRLVHPDEASKLLNAAETDLPTAERRHHLTRLRLLRGGFASCFVAATAEDVPCFFQWLISADENPLLRRAFDDLYLPLVSDEMMVEGAYTPVAFRGQRIMPAAMALIAERAAQMGANRVVTFVGQPNIPSVKGCDRAGFVPYMTRLVVYRMGSRRVTYHPLPENTKNALDVLVER